MIGAPQRESPPPPIARDRLSPTKVLPTTTSGYRFPPQASAGWVRLVSEPSLSQPSFGFYKPESQDLLLSPARVRGCTSAGTRPVASMVLPPERTGAALSHDWSIGWREESLVPWPPVQIVFDTRRCSPSDSPPSVQPTRHHLSAAEDRTMSATTDFWPV